MSELLHQPFNMLCIPRMSTTITKKFIFQTFVKANWGFIEQILEYPYKDEEQKRVLIKLRWNDNVETEKVKTILESNDSIKMVYNMNSPFYWRINKFIPRNKNNTKQKDIQEE